MVSVYDCLVSMCMCVPHALPGAHGDKNKECDPLKLELPSVVSLCMISKTNPVSSARIV